jgi:hypothetical protein
VKNYQQKSKNHEILEGMSTDLTPNQPSRFRTYAGDLETERIKQKTAQATPLQLPKKEPVAQNNNLNNKTVSIVVPKKNQPRTITSQLVSEIKSPHKQPLASLQNTQPNKPSPIPNNPESIEEKKEDEVSALKTVEKMSAIPAFHEINRISNKTNSGSVNNQSNAHVDSGTTVIIKDTKTNRFNILSAVTDSVQQWYKEFSTHKKKSPKYTLPETDHRKGVIQKATSKTGTIFTADNETIKEQIRLRRAQVLPTEKTQPEDTEITTNESTDEIPETTWSPYTETGFNLLESPEQKTNTKHVVIEYKKRNRQKIKEALTPEIKEPIISTTIHQVADSQIEQTVYEHDPVQSEEDILEEKPTVVTAMDKAVSEISQPTSDNQQRMTDEERWGITKSETSTPETVIEEQLLKKQTETVLPKIKLVEPTTQPNKAEGWVSQTVAETPVPKKAETMKEEVWFPKTRTETVLPKIKLVEPTTQPNKAEGWVSQTVAETPVPKKAETMKEEVWVPKTRTEAVLQKIKLVEPTTQPNKAEGWVSQTVAETPVSDVAPTKTTNEMINVQNEIKEISNYDLEKTPERENFESPIITTDHSQLDSEYKNREALIPQTNLPSIKKPTEETVSKPKARAKKIKIESEEDNRIEGLDTNTLAIIVVCGIILLVAIGYAVKFILQEINYHHEREQVLKAETAPLLIGAETDSVVLVTSQIGSLSELILTHTANASTGLSETSIVTALGEEVSPSYTLDLLNFRVLPSLKQSLTAIRFVTIDQSNPVLFMQYVDRNTVLGGMLIWETNMIQDLKIFYDLSEASPLGFIDDTILGNDVRILPANQSEVLVYGLIGDNTLIIANNKEDFTRIVEASLIK